MLNVHKLYTIKLNYEYFVSYYMYSYIIMQYLYSIIVNLKFNLNSHLNII